MSSASHEQLMNETLVGARRLVVKVGSAVITDGGRVMPERLSMLAHGVSALRAAGREVVMVVSGAVAAGHRTLGFDRPPSGVVGIGRRRRPSASRS